VTTALRDNEAQLKGFAKVIRDATKSKRTEDALRESEERFRFALEATKIGAWELDLTTGEAKRTPRHDQIFGYDKLLDEWTYEKFHHHAHPDDREHVDQAFKKALSQGSTWEFECRIYTAKNELRWIWACGAVRSDEEGRPRSITGLVSDVSADKRIEQELREAKDEAERANRQKSAFLANLSHEIRSPLGAISGFSELLREGEASQEENQRFIDTIVRNSSALSQLVDDLLDLSKVEAGQLSYEKQPFELPELIKDVMFTLAQKASEKNISLTSKIDKDVQESVVSDAARLRQILINIVGNAIKFTPPKGEVDVTVKLKRSVDDKKSLLCFAVKDTGIGLAPEEIGKLSRGLARALGGDIVITDCAPGKGCTFEISVESNNMPQQYSEREKEQGDELAINTKLLKGVRVLLAEDSCDTQELMAHVLQRYGAEVVVVDDGAKALECALNDEPEVVLMDIQMPVVDGYTAARMLREKGFNRPIIALTAHAMASEHEKSLRAGCNDHLTKPIDIQQLVATVVKHVKSD